MSRSGASQTLLPLRLMRWNEISTANEMLSLVALVLRANRATQTQWGGETRATSKNGRNRLKCPLPLFPSQTGTASIGYEVHYDDERKPNAKCGQPTARGKWAGNRSYHDRRNVCVGLLRKSGKGSLHSSGLRRPDQLLHKGGSLAGRVEGSYGFGGESRRDGGSLAGNDRNLSRDFARHRSAHSPSRFCSLSFSVKPLGLGVGHVVDLGAAGSGARIACARGGAGRSSVGRRRLASAAPTVLPMVVTWAW